MKRLVQDEGNPWATSQQIFVYEQISSIVNVGDTDLCSTLPFDLLEKLLSANCADFINSLSQSGVASRVLAFKKELSSTKATSSAFNITGGSVTDGVQRFRLLEVELWPKQHPGGRTSLTQQTRSLLTRGNSTIQVQGSSNYSLFQKTSPAYSHTFVYAIGVSFY